MNSFDVRIRNYKLEKAWHTKNEMLEKKEGYICTLTILHSGLLFSLFTAF